ncbi:helix-turn-helix domain-containing protein [Saccharopolyspora pogona]|uniref:helix-turn-helix domain-containing protein n=1 Tax=Saccharopolyspora pogona TaxID=333966 RepID=UPI001CC25AD8
MITIEADTRTRNSTVDNRRSPTRRANPSATPPAPGTSAHGPDETHNGTPQLYTPAEAAALLTVKESWLRRKAGTRSIPCTFIGRHLRFSASNLREIVDSGTHSTRTRRGRPRKTR